MRVHSSLPHSCTSRKLMHHLLGELNRERYTDFVREPLKMFNGRWNMGAIDSLPMTYENSTRRLGLIMGDA